MDFYGIYCTEDIIEFYLNEKIKGKVSNDENGFEELYNRIKDNSNKTCFVTELTNNITENFFAYLESIGFRNTYYVNSKDVSITKRLLDWSMMNKFDVKLLSYTARKFPENLIPFKYKKDNIALLLRKLARSRMRLCEDCSREKIMTIRQIFDFFPQMLDKINVDDLIEQLHNDFSTDEIAETDINILFEAIMSYMKLREVPDLSKKSKEIINKASKLKPNYYTVAYIDIYLSIQRAKTFETQIKLLDREIERHFDKVNQTITTIPGMSKLLAGCIYGEIGEIDRFENHSKLASYVGLVSIQENDESHIKRESNKDLRYYFYVASKYAIKEDDTFGKFYNNKILEGKNEKMALVATSRKLLRIVWKIMKTGDEYYPEE